MKKQTKLAVMLASVALLVVSAASIVSARGWVQQGGNWYYQTNDGEFVTEDIQASGNSKFYLGEDGTMQTDYFLEDFGDSSTNTYYFGSNGAMVTNTWVAIDPSIVNNTGDVVPSAYWYYFGATGKAVKANGSNTLKRTTIDGKKYAFNEYGQMLTGWINNSGEVINPDDDDPYSDAMYYGGDENDGVLHSGWLVYLDGSTIDIHEDKNVLYFYFNPSNNKKTFGNSADDPETKRIDNRMYAFDENGVMLSGWDAYSSDSRVYYSAEDDGHQVKKGWVYAVPDKAINESNYDDDEEKYMYFLSGGGMVYDKTYKVNGKKYAFSDNGIMQKGIVFYKNDGSFYGTVDLDETKGEDVSKLGIFYFKKNDKGNRPEGADATNGMKQFNETDFKAMTVEYFGSDGARRTGANNVEFADDTYTFSTGNNGAHHGINKKKYYSLGILLKASSDIRYGIYATDSEALTTFTWPDTGWENLARNWSVVNTTGGEVKGSKTAKKDADGNYWMINPTNYTLKGIYDVEVKYTDSPLDTAYFPAKDASGAETSAHADSKEGSFYRYWKADSHRYQLADGAWKEVNNAWIPFKSQASDGKTEKNHEIKPTNDYALNFKFN